MCAFINLQATLAIRNTGGAKRRRQGKGEQGGRGPSLRVLQTCGDLLRDIQDTAASLEVSKEHGQREAEENKAKHASLPTTVMALSSRPQWYTLPSSSTSTITCQSEPQQHHHQQVGSTSQRQQDTDREGAPGADHYVVMITTLEGSTGGGRQVSSTNCLPRTTSPGEHTLTVTKRPWTPRALRAYADATPWQAYPHHR